MTEVDKSQQTPACQPFKCHRFLVQRSHRWCYLSRDVKLRRRAVQPNEALQAINKSCEFEIDEVLRGQIPPEKWYVTSCKLHSCSRVLAEASKAVAIKDFKKKYDLEGRGRRRHMRKWMLYQNKWRTNILHRLSVWAIKSSYMKMGEKTTRKKALSKQMTMSLITNTRGTAMMNLSIYIRDSLGRWWRIYSPRQVRQGRKGLELGFKCLFKIS